ncbi:hypothetical protein GCM10022402_39660 [Salinactinospora qingdaonensis]|uniref:Uncharacterized protein n=1 Tax=Salinactinospora qingdaonensis TaxID=702744 RepID=A0ABP7G8V2_9ACTN
MGNTLTRTSQIAMGRIRGRGALAWRRAARGRPFATGRCYVEAGTHVEHGGCPLPRRGGGLSRAPRRGCLRSTAFNAAQRARLPLDPRWGMSPAVAFRATAAFLHAEGYS